MLLIFFKRCALLFFFPQNMCFKFCFSKNIILIPPKEWISKASGTNWKNEGERKSIKKLLEKILRFLVSEVHNIHTYRGRSNWRLRGVNCLTQVIPNMIFTFYIPVWAIVRGTRVWILLAFVNIWHVRR